MDTKQREFILLRADGISYDKIAKDLNTAKGTLIQWSKLFESEIKELQFHSFLQIKEAYSWSKKAKYETLLKQLNKIDNAILEANLSNSSIKDLFTIKNDILFQLENIEKKVSTKANVILTNELGYKEELDIKLCEAE